MFRFAAITLIAMLAATSSHAQVAATQHVEKEIVVNNSNGEPKIERVDAEKVAPGEEVIYSLRFQNEAAEPAEALVLVMPVPKEISYVEGSVYGQGAKIAFSADDGQTYVARGRLTVIEAGAERPAKSDEITHIKWTLEAPLAANERGEVSFRGVLK
jgi:uncharacterized repeat protein (TIGR01451 family)